MRSDVGSLATRRRELFTPRSQSQHLKPEVYIEPLIRPGSHTHLDNDEIEETPAQILVHSLSDVKPCVSKATETNDVRIARLRRTLHSVTTCEGLINTYLLFDIHLLSPINGHRSGISAQYCGASVRTNQVK